MKILAGAVATLLAYAVSLLGLHCFEYWYTDHGQSNVSTSSQMFQIDHHEFMAAGIGVLIVSSSPDQPWGVTSEWRAAVLLPMLTRRPILPGGAAKVEYCGFFGPSLWAYAGYPSGRFVPESIELPTRGSPVRSVLPRHPTWWLVLDIALMTCVTSGVQHAARRVRASFRRSKGRCPACGYDAKELPTCPECGVKFTK